MKKAREFSEEAFKTVLLPLGAYLREVVVCGSWVPFIYHHWLLKGSPGKRLVRTLDVDLAVRENLPVVGQPLVELLRGSGYRIRRRPERPLWEDDPEPQVTHFEFPNAPYLELITPHRGQGRVGTVREVQPGVGAPELEYVEILLEDTQEAAIPGTNLQVRVPTLAAYVYQKVLTFPQRKNREKKEKDLANLFDVLHNFPELHDEILSKVGTLGARYDKGWQETFRKHLEGAFSSPDAEGVRLVEAQQPDPYGQLVQSDMRDGQAKFRELVYSRFRELLDAAGPR